MVLYFRVVLQIRRFCVVVWVVVSWVVVLWVGERGAAYVRPS